MPAGTLSPVAAPRTTAPLPDLDDAITAAYAAFSRALDDPKRIAAEITHLEAVSPIYVGGRWYPEKTRVYARMALAAANVRAQARRELHEALLAAATAAGTRHCAWCSKRINDGDPVEPLAGRLVHARVCTAQFDAWWQSAPTGGR